MRRGSYREVNTLLKNKVYRDMQEFSIAQRQSRPTRAEGNSGRRRSLPASPGRRVEIPAHLVFLFAWPLSSLRNNG
jgi:hypothetical protein